MTDKSMTSPANVGTLWLDGLIKAAKRGDPQSSAMCLRHAGKDLQEQRPLYPPLAQHVGSCLEEAAQKARSLRKEKIEKRAVEVCKALGLISSRRGPKPPYFKPVTGKGFDLTSLVVHFHLLGHPMTRKEGGAFYRAAQVVGSRPGTVEAAYRDYKKREIVQDPTFQSLMLARAQYLIKRSRIKPRPKRS